MYFGLRWDIAAEASDLIQASRQTGIFGTLHGSLRVAGETIANSTPTKSCAFSTAIPSRGTLASSLNFLIPGRLSTGLREFTFEAGLDQDERFRLKRRDTLFVGPGRRPTVVGVLFDISDPNGPHLSWVPGIDLARDLETVAYSLPKPNFSYLPCQRVPVTIDSRTQAGTNFPWGQLSSQITAVRLASHPRPDFAVGVPPAAVKGQYRVGNVGQVGGEGWDGDAIYIVGDTQALRHELGQGVKFGHVTSDDSCVPVPDPIDFNYPSYWPYPKGSSGEYGVEIPALITSGPSDMVRAPELFATS